MVIMMIVVIVAIVVMVMVMGLVMGLVMAIGGLRSSLVARNVGIPLCLLYLLTLLYFTLLTYSLTYLLTRRKTMF